MNKSELIASIAEASGLTKPRAAQALNKVLTNIAAAVDKGETVRLAGFGTFQMAEDDKQQGHALQTDRGTTIPPCRTISFEPDNNRCTRIR